MIINTINENENNENDRKKTTNNNKVTNEKWTGNRIGASGPTAISESLKTNTTLTKLYLGDDDKIEKEKRNKTKKWNMKWNDNKYNKWKRK